MPGFDPSEKRDDHGRWTTGDWTTGNSENWNDLANAAVLVGHTNFLRQNLDEAVRNNLDTEKLYSDGNGNYTEERKKLHEQIIQQFLGKGTSSAKIVYALGGAPGNGKSTLQKSGLTNYEDLDVVNADDIRALIPEYQTLLKDKNKSASVFAHEEASYISKQLIKRIMSGDKGFILDGINDGDYDKLLAKLKSYKDAGNYLRADYVTLDSQLTEKNVENRGNKTGRYVPLTYVREMNSEISALVPKLIKDKAFDEFNLWDTNIHGKPRLILTQKNGETEIYDQKLYEDFLKKKH